MPCDPEPFSTSTLTFDGLVVSSCTRPAEPRGRDTLGTVTSCAMAENTSPAPGCAKWTRAGLAGHDSFGAVTNWTFLLDRWRRLLAMPIRSETVMPLSVVIEAAASLTTDS